MAGDSAAFIETVVGAPVHLVGCSDGAVVALVTALARPDLVRQVVLVAGVYHHDGWVPGAIHLDEESAQFLRSYYGEVSPDGVEHFAVVQAKLDRMHETEPTLTVADLATLANRVLVMVGDDDQVHLEHAVAAYRALPAGELAVVPGTSHGLMVERPDLVNGLILDFLTQPPIQTVAPVRRRP
jgi:pimeloyl-ACP methyl ester carboxylesterase